MCDGVARSFGVCIKLIMAINEMKIRTARNRRRKSRWRRKQTEIGESEEAGSGLAAWRENIFSETAYTGAAAWKEISNAAGLRPCRKLVTLACK